MDIKQRADELLDYVTVFRHDLHQHPELGLREFRTTDRICEELDKLGLSYTRFEPTGLICDIKGELPGTHTVGLRADIDALPITEATGLAWASQTPGVMHACGHDTHAAMLLGAARILRDIRSQFGGTVRCIFQPSEENCQGARTIIAQGAADGVEQFLEVHIWPNFNGSGWVGGFDMKDGAGVSNFKVTVQGQTCHGQFPQQGIDSIVIACQIILALQTVISRRVSPFDKAVISIGKINAGTAPNIVAGETTFEGTIRYHSMELREKLPSLTRELCEGVAQANGGSAHFTYEELVPPLINHPDIKRLVAGAAAKLHGGRDWCLHMPGVMGGEDFTAFQAFGPGAQVYLGGGGDKMGHQPDFTVEDEAMPWGTAMYVQFALDALAELNAGS